ncbi:MAG: LamG domain-containing protein, partial [Candidatus Omnitrophica bacterium]|nr:LamG domain-containing protein [Candidatus Omnitrophota bacterium]
YGNATTTSSGKVGRAGNFGGSGYYVQVNNVSVNTTAGAKNTVEFWMYWKGGNNQMPFGWNTSYDLWLNNNAFGFNTGNSNIEGILGTDFLKNSWHHIVAIFPNAAPDNSNAELWVNGDKKTIVHQFGTGPGSRTVTSQVTISGWGLNTSYKFNGYIDELRIYRITLSPEEIVYRYQNPGYPRDYFDLHNYAFKYDAWQNEYILDSKTVGGKTVYYFYSYGPNRSDDSGAGDDILPRGL